jgi:hypothetical protein
MALTNDSFRGPDPRRKCFVRAFSGFYVEGRAPAEEGEVLEVPLSVAVMLMHSNKAERCDGPARPAPKHAAAAPAIGSEMTYPKPQVAEKAAVPAAKEK